MRRTPARTIRSALVALVALVALGACAAPAAEAPPQPVASSPTAAVADAATATASPAPAEPTLAATAEPTAAEPTLAATAEPTLAATAEPTLAATAATAETTPAAGAASFAPILDVTRGYMLGGIQGTRWLSPELAAPLVKGGEAYRLVTGGTYAGTGQGGAPQKGEVPCDWIYEVDLLNAPTQPQEVPIVAEPGTLAVGGNWELFPRQPQELDTGMQVYRDAVAAELAARGVAEPNVQIGRIVRADLDGDGVDEVLLNATYYRSQAEEDYLSPDATAGDYSLVLLRTLVDGQVVTVPVAENYYVRDEEFVAPLEHVLADVLDLNGDGRLDVVVRSSYYEGSSTTVFEVDGTTVTAVMSEGCGV